MHGFCGVEAHRIDDSSAVSFCRIETSPWMLFFAPVVGRRVRRCLDEIREEHQVVAPRRKSLKITSKEGHHHLCSKENAIQILGCMDQKRDLESIDSTGTADESGVPNPLFQSGAAVAEHVLLFDSNPKQSQKDEQNRNTVPLEIREDVYILLWFSYLDHIYIFIVIYSYDNQVFIR